MTSTLAHAQLRPPVQTDTLVIKSVKYNYMDIKPENWPCEVIYKSTTDFIIGDQVFRISSARRDPLDSRQYTIIFSMMDGSELTFYDAPDMKTISYSGYEFSCAANKPAVNVADEISPVARTTTGFSNALLQGRTLVGSLPRPLYNVNDSGTVVVTIWVDQYGNVTKAQPGSEGTTTKNKTLWSEARKAAMGAHFNQKADAPALQQGTITYIFSLK